SGWTASSDIPTIDFFGGDQPYYSNGSNFCEACGGTPPNYYINRIRVRMPGGSSHELRLDDTPVQTLTYVGTFYAVDGSNLRYESTSVTDGTLYLPDGSRYLLRPSSSGYQFIDRNGN